MNWAYILLLTAVVPSLEADEQLCMNCVGNDVVVDCTFRGLLEVPDCFSGETLYLHLHGNNISHLAADSFLIYPHIEDLELSLNQLTSLPDDVFDPIPNVTRLDLSWNYISKLPNQLFRKTVNLVNINLGYNKIGRVNKHTFEPLKNLKYLFLDGNQITRIDFTFYEPMTILDFSENKLQKIDGAIFEQFHDMDLWMDSNPWVCDCKLKKMMDVLSAKAVDFPFDPKCASPSNVAGRRWSQLSNIITCN